MNFNFKSNFKSILPIKKVSFDFLFLFILFVTAFIAGCIVYTQNEAESLMLIEYLAEGFTGMNFENPFILTGQIFLNNMFVSLFAFVSGVFFGVIPVFIIIVNGFFPGLLFPMVASERGVLFFIAGIIPHGIIEIPAIILACALGFRLGRLSLQKLYGILYAKNDINLVSEFFRSLLLYVASVIPMLFIAAVIEVFLTSRLLLFF